MKMKTFLFRDASESPCLGREGIMKVGYYWIEVVFGVD